MEYNLLQNGYNPNIPHFEVGYIPFTNHLLTSWDIQVALIKDLFTKKNSKCIPNSRRLKHSSRWLSLKSWQPKSPEDPNGRT